MIEMGTDVFPVAIKAAETAAPALCKALSKLAKALPEPPRGAV
jgi:hypothetical protein